MRVVVVVTGGVVDAVYANQPGVVVELLDFDNIRQESPRELEEAVDRVGYIQKEIRTGQAGCIQPWEQVL